MDGAADIRCGVADPATCGLPAVRENSEKSPEWTSWVRHKALYISYLRSSWRSTLREPGREAERPAEGGSRERRQGARWGHMTAPHRPAAPAPGLRRELLFRLSGSNVARPPLLGNGRLRTCSGGFSLIVLTICASRGLAPPAGAPPSILRYYTNKAILWMTIQLTMILGSLRWRSCTDPVFACAIVCPGESGELLAWQKASR